MDMTLYETIQREYSIDNMYRDMEVLVNEIGERMSGTDKLRQCAEYIEGRLKETGLEARIDTFPMYHSYPGEAELKVLAPEAMEVPTRPVCHIASTPPGGIEGEMIYLGVAGYEDYEGVDVSDKIVLADMNWSPGRPEKARIAWEMGAKALVIMNWGLSDSDAIQMGGVKSQWGNPTPDSFRDIPQITVLSISRRSGEALKALCQKGKVQVRLRGEATREWVTARQPIAFLKGGKSNGQYVLVGSHIDAWGKSAICNASGNALNLELARLLYKYRDELHRDVVFTFWDGHEVAESAGSAWYCDRYWQELTDNCVAYLNIDNLAIAETTEPGLEAQPEMRAFLEGLVERVWQRPAVWNQAYKGGGDSSFFGVGVPYINFATEFTEEKLRELNYAFYGPWLHTDFDTIDKVDRGLYQKHFESISLILYSLLQRPVVPYSAAALAVDARAQYEAALAKSGLARAEVKRLAQAVEAYEQCAAEVQKLADEAATEAEVRQANTLLWCFERHSNPLRNVAGRYGQDACCAVSAERPLPGLWQALDNLERYGEDSHDYHLWFTEVQKQCNRVYDALDFPVRFAGALLAK